MEYCLDTGDLEMVKKVSVSNTAIEFKLINGMKLSEERTEK